MGVGWTDLKTVLLICMGALLVIGAVYLGRSRTHPSREQEAFYSFQRQIQPFLQAQGPFTFSVPGKDGRTGWSALGSNRWEFYGVLERPQQAVPWRATVVDRGTNWSLILLRIGQKVVISR